MIKLLTGNEAAAYGALMARADVVCAYPITPQSRIPELLSEFYAQGKLKGRFVNVESEMSAIGYLTGASAAGVRVFTATSSQGLAWMHEALHNASGSRLPMVMTVVNRPLCAPANLTCDQSDSLSQRDTGWLQFYCETNQEVLDTVIQAYRLAESISLPVMVCLDGIYLSHVYENVAVPDQEQVDRFLPPYRPTYKVDGYTYKLYQNYPPEEVGYRMDDFGDHMKARSIQHGVLRSAVARAIELDREFHEVFGRGYPLVETYECQGADMALVVSGSAVSTARLVIDQLREEGKSVGLVKLKMFRPFPDELVRDALKSMKKVLVIERDLSAGQGGIFHQEISAALNSLPGNDKPTVFGFVAGLGGKDITADLFRLAISYSESKQAPESNPLWLGLDGDTVSH